jgi:hypothetical protein
MTASNEAQIQEQLAHILEPLGFVREFALSKSDRIDFYHPENRLGVEVKVKSSLQTVLRQLGRYVLSPQIDGLVLATTQAKHLDLPEVLGGKPLRGALLHIGF